MCRLLRWPPQEAYAQRVIRPGLVQPHGFCVLVTPGATSGRRNNAGEVCASSWPDAHRLPGHPRNEVPRSWQAARAYLHLRGPTVRCSTVLPTCIGFPPRLWSVRQRPRLLPRLPWPQILAISHSVKDVLGGVPAEQILGRNITEAIPWTSESQSLLMHCISVRARPYLAVRLSAGF